MFDTVHKSKIVCELENEIQKGCKVIVYDLDNLDVIRSLCKTVNSNHNLVEIWTSRKYPEEIINNIKLITSKDIKDIMAIYHLYEFTDKLLVLSENFSYPVLLNYVLQGILTEQEMIEAFIYKL